LEIEIRNCNEEMKIQVNYFFWFQVISLSILAFALIPAIISTIFEKMLTQQNGSSSNRDTNNMSGFE
jgi:hypothetical protein